MKLFRELPTQIKDYLLVTLIGLIIVMVSFYIILPQVRNLVGNYQLLSEEKAEVSKLIMKRNVLESVDSNFTAKYLADAEAAIPSEKDAASILVALENLSGSAQITIEQVDLTPGLVSTSAATTSAITTVAGSITTRRGAQSLVVDVAAKGSTAQIMDFIRQLQNMRRVFDIESLQLSYPLTTEDFLTADMKLHAYFLPPITEIGAIEAELPQITPGEEKVLSELTQKPILSESLVGEIDISGVLGKGNLFQP